MDGYCITAVDLNYMAAIQDTHLPYCSDLNVERIVALFWCAIGCLVRFVY